MNKDVESVQFLLKNTVFSIKKYVFTPSWVYNFDDVREDIEKVIRNSVRKYVSTNNVILFEEDLVSECWAKFTNLVNNKKVMRKLGTRCKFFSYIKAAFSNMLIGLLNSQEYTEKRTGIPKDCMGGRQSKREPELRLDKDENVEIPVEDTSTELVLNSVYDFLNPLQRIVLDNLVSPSKEALFYAAIDCRVGQSSVDVIVSDVHLARAVGIDVKKFKEIARSVKRILKNIDSITHNYEEMCRKHGFVFPKSIDFSEMGVGVSERLGEIK